MGWYRRYVFDAFRRKIGVPTKNPIQQSITRISGFTQPIFRNSRNQFNSKSCFCNGAKRFCFVSREQGRYKGWSKIMVVLVGCGVVITDIYFHYFETVPYTKRTHFVSLSRSAEKGLAEIRSKQIKAMYEGKILPPLHPESIRVQKILEEMIEGLEKGLRKEQDSNYLEWEVIVVDEPLINCLSTFGGKIVVFTGFLNHFRADAEVATIIGHEVSHVVARHYAEQYSKDFWIFILKFVLYPIFMPDIVKMMSDLFLMLPLSRRMEMEADSIGLLLMASAGYDPRVAPPFYEELGRTAGESSVHNYGDTHPSAKIRAKVLAEAQVMEEALSIYREVQAGRGVHAFL